MTRVDAMSMLFAFAAQVTYQPAKRVLLRMLNDPRFARGYGAKVGTDHAHHAYEGGLPVHTFEVVDIAMSILRTEALKVNADVLLTAAIFHDYMKVKDYDLNGAGTDYKKYIQHVAGGYAEWAILAFEYEVSDEFAQAVGHCLLSHHGRLEWGSPVVPKTVEAQILHFADMLSMAYGVDRVKNEDPESKIGLMG